MSEHKSVEQRFNDATAVMDATDPTKIAKSKEVVQDELISDAITKFADKINQESGFRVVDVPDLVKKSKEAFSRKYTAEKYYADPAKNTLSDTGRGAYAKEFLVVFKKLEKQLTGLYAKRVSDKYVDEFDLMLSKSQQKDENAKSGFNASIIAAGEAAATTRKNLKAELESKVGLDQPFAYLDALIDDEVKTQRMEHYALRSEDAKAVVATDELKDFAEDIKKLHLSAEEKVTKAEADFKDLYKATVYNGRTDAAAVQAANTVWAAHKAKAEGDYIYANKDNTDLVAKSQAGLELTKKGRDAVYTELYNAARQPKIDYIKKWVEGTEKDGKKLPGLGELKISFAKAALEAKGATDSTRTALDKAEEDARKALEDFEGKLPASLAEEIRNAGDVYANKNYISANKKALVDNHIFSQAEIDALEKASKESDQRVANEVGGSAEAELGTAGRVGTGVVGLAAAYGAAKLIGSATESQPTVKNDAGQDVPDPNTPPQSTFARVAKVALGLVLVGGLALGGIAAVRGGNPLKGFQDGQGAINKLTSAFQAAAKTGIYRT